PAQSKANAEKDLAAARSQAQDQLKSARSTLADATKALDDAHAKVATELGVPATTTNAELKTQCDDLAATIKQSGTATPAQLKQGQPCRDFLKAFSDYSDAQAALTWAEKWAESRADVTDGQLLFESYCARCHTQGWSIFDPTVPDGTSVLGLAGG